MSETNEYTLWDYWMDDGYIYVVTQENKTKTLRLMWKKNNDSNKKI